MNGGQYAIDAKAFADTFPGAKPYDGTAATARQVSDEAARVLAIQRANFGNMTNYAAGRQGAYTTISPQAGYQGSQGYLSPNELKVLYASGGTEAVVTARNLRANNAHRSDAVKANVDVTIATMMGISPPSPPPPYDPVASAIRIKAEQDARIKSEISAAASAEANRVRTLQAQSQAVYAAATQYAIDFHAENARWQAANKLAMEKAEAEGKATLDKLFNQANSFDKEKRDREFRQAVAEQARSQAEVEAAHAANRAMVAKEEARRNAEAKELEAKEAIALAQRAKDASEAKVRAQQALRAAQDEITRQQVEYDAKNGTNSVPKLPPAVIERSNFVNTNLAKAVDAAREAAVARGIQPVSKPLVSSATFTSGIDKAANIKGQAELTAAARAAAVAAGLSAEDTKALMSTVSKAISKSKGKKQPAKLKAKTKASNKVLAKPKKRR